MLCGRSIESLLGKHNRRKSEPDWHYMKAKLFSLINLIAGVAVYRYLITGGWLTNHYQLNDPNIVNLVLAVFEPIAIVCVIAYWVWRKSFSTGSCSFWLSSRFSSAPAFSFHSALHAYVEGKNDVTKSALDLVSGIPFPEISPLSDAALQQSTSREIIRALAGA